jgi:hypothetical protein
MTTVKKWQAELSDAAKLILDNTIGINYPKTSTYHVGRQIIPAFSKFTR